MGSANSGPIADGPESRLPETISPELVLVDPELRQEALARLEVARPLNRAPSRPPIRHPHVLRVAPAPLPPARPYAHPRRRRALTRLAPVIVPFALVFGVVVAMAGSEVGSDTPSLVAPAGTIVGPPSEHAKPPRAPAPSRVARPRQRTVRTLPSKSTVEREVLLQAVQRPRGKLPQALIDQRTGLAKNGLEASCVLSGGRSYACVVGPARHATKGVRVRYRTDARGRAVFDWFRARSG
jgi:hypothetical protein